MVVPRWVRDGGVVAHVAASAAALAPRGTRVAILVGEDRISGDPRRGHDVSQPGAVQPQGPGAERGSERRSRVSRRSCTSISSMTRSRRVPAAHRAGGDLRARLRRLHVRRITTSAPGQECLRAHGPGCVANLLRCAHTRDPRIAARRTIARRAASWRRCSGGHGGLLLERRRPAPGGSTGSSAGGWCRTSRRSMPSDRLRARAQRAAGGVRRAGGRAQGRRDAGASRARGGCASSWSAATAGSCPRCAAWRGAWASRSAISSRAGWSRTGWRRSSPTRRWWCVPSVWPEPFGIIGIEGFAAGRPAVASGTGGIGDWLRGRRLGADGSGRRRRVRWPAP